MNELMITTKQLVKTYGRGAKAVEAVRGVDLEVLKGQIFGLVGPDGAGKTTTIQMLCGILTPTAGTATVAGVEVTGNGGDLGGVIGFMSEGFTLYGDLSVEENIDFSADLYKVPPEVAAERKEELLSFARMEAARHRQAKHLSGGMKKKLALACTLVYRPKVLFLDEPTTGVDPSSRQDFWKILYEFLSEGITIFVTTPYMDEAERCHKVALMRNGQIIANDAPSILKRSIQGVSVELVAKPQTQAVSQLLQMPGVSQLQIFGERLHLLLRDGQSLAERLPGELTASGVKVDDYRTTTPSLEDVFITMIEEQPNEETPLIKSVPKPATPNRLMMSQLKFNKDNGIAVHAEGLVRRFGDLTAVDNVNFTVRRGEIFGFLGPNGSGKTTTIRMLSGILPPTSGQASIAGFDVSSDRNTMKKHIGYMSQKFSLYNDLTVGENIRFYGALYSLPPARLAERSQSVLEMAGLTGKEHLLTRDLSGGWKQRLGLGCAILHEPEILFLDEPTSGVDPVSRREFWDLIFELSTSGVTVFITTHYMDEAEHCHNLGLLYRGRLIARGSPEELRTNMKVGSMLEVPVRDPLAASILLEGLPEFIQTSIFGDKLHALVWEIEAGQCSLEQVLVPKDLITGSINHVPISLEDLFMFYIVMEEAGRKAR